ncbi:hypothetical protein HanXRQr2_Chr08g0327751 [Helianthus annuus]|uniref:Uncharacterized protein n=1 Tax=Helianthus annuus TaxID=4232 RepID=A0A9K3NCG1_HELAN|nr:hypothetical protein HanXRQr2_Chr08g0327751 [Helianthus annuus]KAJ0900715.1 hypothetical protein HanPSC8_Chr08g0316921 [Helianthus annuus]
METVAVEGRRRMIGGFHGVFTRMIQIGWREWSRGVGLSYGKGDVGVGAMSGEGCR